MGKVNLNVGNFMISICVLHYVFGESCDLCVERKQCRISYVLQLNDPLPVHFLWRKDGVDCVICYPAHTAECYFIHEQEQFEKANIELKDGNIYLEVVFNTKRGNKTTSEGKWDLFSYQNDLKHLYYCYVFVYNKIEEIYCTHLASPSGLEIKCTSHRLFPKSACHFSISYKQVVSHQMLVHYNHSITNTDPIYYTTECSLSVPLHLIMPGVLKYQVTMFPNITTTSATFSMNELEKTAEGTINIGFPSIKMVACPDLIEEGNIFNCTCERNDTSDIPTLLYWYSSQSTNEKMTILSKTAIKNASDFVCKAVSGLGWTSNINYSPTIKTVEKKSSNMLTCSSNKPYNCSNECYGDDELCLKDTVYSCISALSVIHLHEWCLTINVSDTIPRESKSCHKICLSLQVKTKDENNDNLKLIIGTSIPILLFSILIGLCVIYGKPNQLLKGENYENRNLNQDAVQHNNHLRELGLIEEDQQAVIPLLDLPNEHQEMESSGTLPQGPTRILQEVEVDEQNRTHCTSDDQPHQSNRFTQLDNLHQEGPTYLSDATDDTDLMKSCCSMEDELLDLRESHQSITVSAEEPSTQYSSNHYQQQVTTDETEVAGLANTLEEDVTDDTNIIQEINTDNEQDFTVQTDVITQEECYKREKNPSHEGFQYQKDVKNLTLEDCLLAETNSSSSQPNLPIATKDELIITFHKLKRCGTSVVKVLLPISIFTPISQLKENNKGALRIVAGYQQWEFAGTVLADDRCLKDYNIKSGDNITIILM